MRLHGDYGSLTVIALPLAAASIQATKPEEVGLSSERLQRIHQTIQRHIDAHDITGAVTLVARKGRIAHFEAHGVMDQESKKPMAKDGLFWIASMSKPITGVAILMLLEEGKVRLNDPVSKFIPEFKGMKVAVMQDRPAGSTSSAPPAFYTVPATREITIQDLLTHVSGLASGGAAAVPKSQGRPKAGREAGRLHSAPGRNAARFPARLAVALQPRRGV